MKPVVVANSTPLIGLSRIRRLHILEELFGNVIVPADEGQLQVIAEFVEVLGDGS